MDDIILTIDLDKSSLLALPVIVGAAVAAVAVHSSSHLTRTLVDLDRHAA